jgi:C4-dicarboxylate-specific signal transduction histidine kinase
MTESELLSLQRANQELRTLNATLRSAQDQLLQSERLASIGQLAAGVAHEINNPIGYVFSNFGTLQAYLERLFEMLDAYEQAEAALADSSIADRLATMRARVELDYLKQDIPVLMSES